MVGAVTRGSEGEGRDRGKGREGGHQRRSVAGGEGAWQGSLTRCPHPASLLSWEWEGRGGKGAKGKESAGGRKGEVGTGRIDGWEGGWVGCDRRSRGKYRRGLSSERLLGESRMRMRVRVMDGVLVRMLGRVESLLPRRERALLGGFVNTRCAGEGSHRIMRK
jgi:hypothetical protein